MKLPRKAYAALFLTPLLLLISCVGDSEEPDLIGGGDPSTRLPPPIGSVAAPPSTGLDVPNASLVSTSGRRVEGGSGTSCWAGVCADHSGIVTNVEPVVLSGSDAFSISFEAGLPSAMTSGWVSAEGAQSSIGADGRTWRGVVVKLEQDGPDEAVSQLSPGRYVLVVQAVWEGRGDALYGFYIERR